MSTQINRWAAFYLAASCLAAFSAAGCATTSSGGDSADFAALATVPASQAWRQSVPVPEPAPEVEAPRFESFLLKNGIRVILSERHDLPLVSMEVAIRGGSADEGADKAGLANLTYDLLTEGAGGKDAVAVAEAFAELGTSPSTGAGDTGGAVGATSLTRNAEQVLGLLAALVREPDLDSAAFQRLQSRQIAELERYRGEPNYLARLVLTEAVYGPTHPYGHPGSGTVESVQKLTVADAKAFWNDYAQPDNIAIVFVGDIDAKQAREWASKHFGDWKGKAKSTVVAKPVETNASKRVLMVPKPGLEQTVIAMGRPGIGFGDAREWALRVGTAAWGGTFGSRLNMNLREANGFTYGARAYVRPQLGTGSLLISTSVRRDVTGPALREIFNELDGLTTRPLEPRELQDARDALLLSIPGNFETVHDLSSAGANLFIDALPLDRYAAMIRGYASIDENDARAAVNEFFQKDRFQIVLVGDPDVIRAAAKELDLGQVVEVNP